MKLISDQVDSEEITLIVQLLENTIGHSVDGDVVEFGCYIGTTSLFLQRTLLDKDPTRKLYVYDSFAGLPKKRSEDESPAGMQFKAGELLASKKEFVSNFKKANLPLPVIKKGWFNELLPQDVPETICLAFLDGDYYDSILDPLKLVWSRISTGGYIIVDDYTNEALPGARKAVDEWLKTHTYRSLKSQASLAIIEK